MKIDRIIRLPFFFILGRPRSGTTLLRTLLDAHPRVQIPLENSGMIHLLFKYGKKKKWNQEERRKLLAELLAMKNVRNWELDMDGVRELFQKAPDKVSFHELIRLCYFSYNSEFPKEELSCLGDKSPVNSLYSRKLFRAFPDAKFIHLVRDYRANLASMSRQKIFIPSETAILMQWKKSANQIDRLAKKYPERFLLLRYEDLAENPEKSFSGICGFLDIPYMPELLDTGTREKAIGKLYSPEFIAGWQPNLTKGITTDHTDKWESELSPASIRKADYIAGSTGKRYNYKVRFLEYPFSMILGTEIKKALFSLNELNRYLYDRLPYRLKIRIRNRKHVLSYELIRMMKKRFVKR